jgi:ABC-type antimicrobial peptide transport system permease subunit
MMVEIRTMGEPFGVLRQARAAVEALDRDLPLIDVRTQEQQIEQTLGSERVFARLTSGFGLVALLLASIGVYGLMAYSVARRTGEIGIRMALGARV